MSLHSKLTLGGHAGELTFSDCRILKIQKVIDSFLSLPEQDCVSAAPGGQVDSNGFKKWSGWMQILTLSL